jgi:cytochrome c oxidase assembly protein subunit 15
MQNSEKSIKTWIFISIICVLSMVFIGGLTRLTRSGLSITEWNFLSGIFPPFSENSWINEFEKYKKIPEFKAINSEMKISEFKLIYLTEYFHRLFGRLTGLIILIPLILFLVFKKINIQFFLRLSGIFSLIILQGIIGWLMVRSGLKERISVDEFMLGFHLIFALLIFSLLSLEFFRISHKSYKKDCSKKSIKNHFFFICFLTFFLIPCQIFLGGLVAGLHINGFCFQNVHALCNHNPFKIIGFENFFIIKNLFIHRNFAILVFFLILISIFNNFRKKICTLESLILIFILLFQMALGISALCIGNKIYNIIFSSIHQINAFLIMLLMIKIFHKYKKIYYKNNQ